MGAVVKEHTADYLDEVEKIVKDVKYGSVTLIIQDGKVKTRGPNDEILPTLLGTSSAVPVACGKLS